MRNTVAGWLMSLASWIESLAVKLHVPSDSSPSEYAWEMVRQRFLDDVRKGSEYMQVRMPSLSEIDELNRQIATMPPPTVTTLNMPAFRVQHMPYVDPCPCETCAEKREQRRKWAN